MPLELLAVAPGKVELRTYQDPPLKPDQVRVKSRLSAEKHGTNLLLMRGASSVNEKAYDNEMSVFLPRDSGKGWSAKFPMKTGNMTAGVVVEVGADVKGFRPGDRVFGHLPIRQTHTVKETALTPAPKSVPDEALVCEDPALVALLSIRESGLRLGDTAAVFGMGAIGLMTAQMARLAGASFVVAVEPHENKRALALKYGADLTLDPLKCDAGLEIRLATGRRGVDVTVETSGVYAALQQAIRGTRFAGAIVTTSWYEGGAADLFLGEEWHFNRHVLVSGARLESVPYRDHPRWDADRVKKTVLDLFEKKRLTIEGMLDPVVPLEEAVEVYRLLIEEPHKVVKCAFTYR